jgi:hypothetical protein
VYPVKAQLASPDWKVVTSNVTDVHTKISIILPKAFDMFNFIRSEFYSLILNLRGQRVVELT